MKKEAKRELKFYPSQRFKDDVGCVFLIINVWYRGLEQSSVDFIRFGIDDGKLHVRSIERFRSLFENNKLELL